MDRDYVGELVARLEQLGPMPDDDSLALRTDLLQQYQDVINEVYDLVTKPDAPKAP